MSLADDVRRATSRASTGDGVQTAQRRSATSRPNLVAVRKTRVSATVVQQIQSLIHSGELRRGQQLPSERELTELLGVSRPSVREALRLLEVMGYIRSDAGRGTFVSGPPALVGPDVSRRRLDLLEDEDLFYQLAVARQAIEPRIAALAARSATKEDVEHLYRLHEEAGALVHARDMVAWTHADLALHNAIAEVARNLVFLHILDDLQDVLLTMRQLSVANVPGQRPAAAHREHAAIIEPIASGDEEGAARAMMEHFANWLRAYSRARRNKAYRS
jgi:GntR family transcriptional repressor for pyruvate dehydrogenase complex